MSHPLEYVVDKALMMCDKGAAPGFFMPTFNTTTKIEDLLVATEADKIPLANIPTFVLCSVTSAACTPIPTMWQEPFELTVKDQKTLLFRCTMQCGAGGKMEFLTSGQIPLPAETEAEIMAMQEQARHDLKEAESVGESGFWEGMIPIWGSGRDLIAHVQTGDWGWAAFDAGMLVWDVGSIALGAVSFGAGTALMQGGKAGIKTAAKAVAKSFAKEAVVEPIKALGKLGKGTLKLATKEGRQLAKDFFKKTVDDIAMALGKVCVHACFAKGTLVETTEGKKPIEDIRIGDYVWSYDTLHKQYGYKQVLKAFSRYSDKLVELQIGNEKITVTAEHPFYSNREWIEAGHLRTGDVLYTMEGKIALLKKVRVLSQPVVLHAEPYEESQEVYNLEVEDWHTYFVGEEGILTHNKCDELTEMAVDALGVKRRRLKPNTSYMRNGYEYTTDEFGRIIEAKGKLRLDKAARDDYAQRVVGKGDGRVAGDAGGHLIGSQFGGIGNNANMVPMKHEGVNAYPNGTWGSMEDRWKKALDEGKEVEVKIEPVYTDASGRPSSFEVTETIDGVEKTKTVANPN